MKQEKEANPALHSKASETTDKGYRRAREILLVARSLLVSEGYAGLSMRTVASRVGVSLSNVQHYYPSKDALLEALLIAMREEYQRRIDGFVAGDAGGSKLAQFEAVIDYLLDEAANVESSAVLRELWALARRHEFAAEIVDKMAVAARRTLRHLIQGLSVAMTPAELEMRAAMVLAQLHGLTLMLASGKYTARELKALRLGARQAVLRLAVGASVESSF
jgi:AcrR family transcriptional regulator